MTNKQQQLVAQRNEKEKSAKQRALTDAVRSEQHQEEINGFRKREIPEPLADDDGLGPESEDNDDELHTAFSSVTIPPIIKTRVGNGRTLVYRIQNSGPGTDQEIPSEPKSQSYEIAPSKKSRTLVRRVVSDSSPTSYPSMVSRQLEPEVADMSDGEPNPSAPASITTYHDSQESFHDYVEAQAAPERTQKEPPERKRKETPATTSAETTVVTKKIKAEGSGSRGRIRQADFDELTRSVIEETISIYRAQIGSVEPFPERADDHDTVKQAWLEVCTSRNLRVELEEGIFKLIIGRASQARGFAKTTSKPYFIAAYNIDGIGSKREIRDNVEQLLEGSRFIYKDPVSKTGIFRAPLIQTIINKVWFKNKEDDGVIHPEFSENNALPMATMAFVQTVIENNLDEWVTGDHVDVPFTATAYKTKYHAHLKFIMDFEKKTRDADIIPRLLRHMLKVARKHAKVSGGASQASNISNAEIEAAKQEWADLVLSEDDE